MADINIKLPLPDSTNSVEIAQIEAVTIDNLMQINKAFDNKNNSMHIIVNAETEGELCILKGDVYPNSMLGDLNIHCAQGINDIIIEDLSRFEDKDGNIHLSKSDELTGTIFAVAKRAGLRPADSY